MTQETVIKNHHEPLPGRKYYLEVFRCVGACSLPPVTFMDIEVHGRVRPIKFSQVIGQLPGEGI
jgi:NADH:ubiquinone oxidoreductase subunit E